MMQNIALVKHLAEESAQFVESNSYQGSGRSHTEMGYQEVNRHPHLAQVSWGHHHGHTQTETGSIGYSEDCTLSADPTDNLSAIGRMDAGYRLPGLPSWKSHPMGLSKAFHQTRFPRAGSPSGAPPNQQWRQVHNQQAWQTKPTMLQRGFGGLGATTSLKKQPHPSTVPIDRDAALRSTI